MSRFRLSLVGPPMGILVTLGGLLTACQVAEPPAGAATAALEQWSGPHSGVTVASHRVLRDTAAWNTFWQDARTPAPRTFNPTREQAVAIFVGERRTGGYTVRVESVGAEAGRMVVTYLESPPPRGSMVTQALTSPWALVVMSRSAFPVDVRPAAPAQPSPARE